MVKDEEKKGLKELKKEYDVLAKKYSLPGFEEMNKDFHIEKISEQETELLLWEIKRLVGDKLANYMRFVENLLNPVNVPMFIFSIVKGMDEKDKKKLGEMYKELMKNELMFIKSDLHISEENEAGFIKVSFELWQKMKKELMSILSKVDEKWEDKIETPNKGYFG